MLWVFIIIAIALLVVRRWKINRILNFASKIPCGIRSCPFIGHGYLFIGDAVSHMKAFQRSGRDAINNGGMSSLWVGSNYYMVAVDAVDIDVIMKTCLDKDDVLRFGRKLTGNGSIFAPVDIWRTRRRILTPTFNKKNLNRFVTVFARQSSILVEQMKLVAGKGVVSVWKHITNYTLDSICETTMDLQLDAQQNPEIVFIKALEVCNKLIAARMVQPWLYSDAIYRFSPYYADFVKNKKYIYDFINEAIISQQTASTENIKNSSSTDTKSFIKLLIQTPIGDPSYTDVILQEEILVILIAASDTTATGISFVMSMMAKHPDIQIKVVEELQDVFGDSDRPVTVDDLPRLQYTEAVIKETLRLYPPVPLMPRRTTKEVKLPSGVTLINGCSVLVNIWATHRNPVYWGEDAEQFRPDRFLNGSLKHPAAFLAFGGGPRSCLGYAYAMMSMKTSVATLLRNYRVLSAYADTEANIKDSSNLMTDPDKPLNLAFELMLRDVDGFKVKLERRSKLQL